MPSAGRIALVVLLLVGATVVAGRQANAAGALTVDTFDDTFDGTCADADCSLRDAIADAPVGGTVRVPAGFYALTKTGAGGIGEGDLDVDRDVHLIGVGETGAFIDASGLGDRVLDIAASVRIHHLTFLGGEGVPTGGIARFTSGSSRLTFVTMLGGRAVDGGAGAVGAGGPRPHRRSWLSGNRATERGGAIVVRGRATIVRATLSGNRAGAGGAAWVGPSGDLTVDASTLSGNVATRGGGAIHVRGHASVRSTTGARNRAAVGGAVMATASATVDVASSLFAVNDASTRGPACSRRVSSAGHNLADVVGCGLTGPGDRIVRDARIRVLRQNGGPTPTHALLIGSPAVDRGAGCADVDQRGAPRRRCDIGAYELVFCLGRPVTIVGTPGPDDLSGGLQRDVFLGRGGDDHFQGSLDRDRACGGPGDDVLIGGPDPDLLAGNGGSDRLVGEGGGDLLIGGSGTDVCRGGAGSDVIRRCEAVP